MSRCRNCTLSFAEENGWQEFCSIDCAREYFTRGKKGAALVSAFKKFNEWLADPKNARTVRTDGARATPPPIGKIVERTYHYTEIVGSGKMAKKVRLTRKIRENVGSEIVIRPITDEERRVARSWRGRGSFGENHISNQTWQDLPSKHDRVGLAWFPHDE